MSGPGLLRRVRRRSDVVVTTTLRWRDEVEGKAYIGLH